MHYRRAGVPTWAISGIFMSPDDIVIHGLNVQVPKAAFYEGLDHWNIVLKTLAGRAH